MHLYSVNVGEKEAEKELRVKMEEEKRWVDEGNAEKEIEISEASSGKGYKPFNFVYILNVTKINL